MSPYDDDESFDEFDLDDLPNDALDELEINAIQFTQTQHNDYTSVNPVLAAGSDYGDDFEDEDLDDNLVIDESRSTPAVNSTFQHRRSSQHTTLAPRAANGPSYHTAVDRHSIAAPPLFNHSQPSISLPQRGSESPRDSSESDRFRKLQRQLDEITRERNALKENLNAKTGEIAIIRSKQEKTAREYEREITGLRQLNAEALAKQQRELDAARQSERAAAVERDFLKQDTAEAVRARRVAQAKEKATAAEPLTPRKKKLLAHRDGFDDDEIEFLSPSKNSPNKLRKTNTPTKPGKRKRKTPDSPAGPLEVIDLAEPSLPESQHFPEEELLKKLSIQDERYDFLGTMLDHKFDSSHRRTIEELGQYSIPSNNNESIQSSILAAIPTLGCEPVNNLPIEFCQLIIRLWTKCMDEKYFDPVYLFVDILTFALELKTSFIAPHLIDGLVPLITKVVEPILTERFREPSTPIPHDTKTGTTAGLSLLYITALGCMCEERHIIRCWRFLQYDMTMLAFTPNQQMADVELMLKLLSTSVTKNSFGAPAEDEVSDRMVMTNILDKLTLFLVKVPNKPYSTDKYETEVVSKLRLQVLQLFTSMTRSSYASRYMISHKDMIGRLVLLISDELDVLYNFEPGRDASIRIISVTTRLLYHLITKYEDSINMGSKLSAIPGGNQKYLLALARLNFSEDDLVLEAGMYPDVATCALELLELFVTPEEGDAIHAAFSSQ